jgi:hypothetical protein
MSQEDRYYTCPLSILKSGVNELEVLEACLNVGTVNAGIAYHKYHGEDEFESLLEQAKEEAEKQKLPSKPSSKLELTYPDGTALNQRDAANTWNHSLAGWKIMRLNGGSITSIAQCWLKLHRQNEVFFKIRSDWLWGAIYTARLNHGEDIKSDFNPLSWREFRILAAILSAPVNKTQGFTFLGWESIQARACGYHSKSKFISGKDSLPPHCMPLSRSKIDLTTSRLEVLKFYLRFRYSKGNRGGKTAYSLRHESREKLAEAVGKYQKEYCFKQTLANNRAKDRELTLGLQLPSKPPAT